MSVILKSGSSGNTAAVDANGSLQIQRFDDLARTPVTLCGTALAVGATGVETALTLTLQRSTGAATSAASHQTPAGKTLRVQALIFSVIGNANATTAAVTFRLRYNPAGAVVTTTPLILFATRAGVSGTLAGGQQPLIIPLPDEWRMPTGDGSGQFGFTCNAVFVTNAPTVDVQLVGYEV